jgi:hypothetical protein
MAPLPPLQTAILRAWACVAAAATASTSPAAAAPMPHSAGATDVCNVVGGGTVSLPQCFTTCSNLGCYLTWTMVNVDGERRFFGQFTPLASDPEAPPMPVLISMSDSQDVCRQTAASQVAVRYGYSRVCAGMGRSRGEGGWAFGNDGVMNSETPLPCDETAAPREGACKSQLLCCRAAQTDTPTSSSGAWAVIPWHAAPYLAAILDVLAADPLLDADQVWAEGFSLNSMFAGWASFCSQPRIRGVWQVPSLSRERLPQWVAGRPGN